MALAIHSGHKSFVGYGIVDIADWNIECLDHRDTLSQILFGACGCVCLFCILNVNGDVLYGGELYFVEAAKTLKAARRRAEELAKLGPGQYVIYNAETGDEVSIMGSPKRRILSFGQIREKHSRNNLM